MYFLAEKIIPRTAKTLLQFSKSPEIRSYPPCFEGLQLRAADAGLLGKGKLVDSLGDSHSVDVLAKCAGDHLQINASDFGAQSSAFRAFLLKETSECLKQERV